MSNNKRNKRIMLSFALFLIAAVLFNGCNNFLAENPTQNLTKGHQFSGNSDLQALANGPYQDVQLWDDGAGTFLNLPLAFEYFTGEGTDEDAHVSFNNWVNDNITGGEHGFFNVQWADWYQGVQDANNSINIIKKMPEVTDMQRSKGLGEDRALRAYFYFNLVRYFGDVPMFTKNATSPSPAATQLPRTSLKKIYDEIIIPDLVFAIDSSALVDTRSTGGEVTKYVARALLADVYLTAAGYPYQEVATDTSKQSGVKKVCGRWILIRFSLKALKHSYKKHRNS